MVNNDWHTPIMIEFFHPHLINLITRIHTPIESDDDKVDLDLSLIWNNYLEKLI